MTIIAAIAVAIWGIYFTNHIKKEKEITETPPVKPRCLFLFLKISLLNPKLLSKSGRMQGK